MMEKFSVVSVNVRGIRAEAKRIKIFTQLKEKIHSGIFLFQETHSKIEDEEKWKKEWGSDIFFNHGSSNSRGTLIGFSNNLNIKNCDYKQDSEGRIQLCKFELEEQKYIIVNLYNDNVQSKQIETLKNLEKMIENAQPLENEIIIGGDFNFIFDKKLDAYGGRPELKLHSIAEVNKIISKFDLCDIFRIRNPEKKNVHL